MQTEVLKHPVKVAIEHAGDKARMLEEGTLKGIKQEKKAYKEQHRLFFEALSESEKVEYATKMAHDAQIYDEPDFDPSELQSDYYRGLYDLDNRKNNVDSYKALF